MLQSRRLAVATIALLAALGIPSWSPMSVPAAARTLDGQANAATEKAVLAALRRSAWRPAFRNGQPVAVNDYTFTEQVYVKLPKTAE